MDKAEADFTSSSNAINAREKTTQSRRSTDSLATLGEDDLDKERIISKAALSIAELSQSFSCLVPFSYPFGSGFIIF